MTTRKGRQAGTSKGQVDEARVRGFIERLLLEDFHVKRVMSISDAVLGVLHGAALAVHAIGAGLAALYGLDAKHATKQVDRLLSNTGIDLADFFALWVPWVVGARREVQVTMDWTEFDADRHATLSMNVATTHGRATPLLWMTIDTGDKKVDRPSVERALVSELKALLPDGVACTLLADRWFGNQELYEHCKTVGVDFVFRFRGIITVEDESGRSQRADAWLGDKRLVQIRNARVTGERKLLAQVVGVRDPGMEEPWFLASSRADLTARQLVDAYGRRFTTEECFRDQKDPRYGLGMSQSSVKRVDRRDRLFMIAALAQALLTLLGAAAERSGVDRAMKVNTVKRRTHSLFRQGLYWFQALPNQPDKRAVPLVRAFDEIVREQAALMQLLGVV
jgi:hypothetical protein